jgi:hypothetical protein
VLNHTHDLQNRHSIGVTSFAPPQLGEPDVPPAVPYQAVSYVMNGLGHYHEFGAFLAAFENSAPFIRAKSLSLEPASIGLVGSGERESLAFRLEFATLVKTNTPPPASEPPKTNAPAAGE